MGGEALGGRRATREEIDKTLEDLKEMGFFDCCEKYDICGSYRREKKDSGDIDILFIPNEKYNDWIADFKGDKQYGGFGDAILLNGIQIDLFAALEDSYACQQILWTGPPTFNIWLKGKAMRRGMFFCTRGLYYSNMKITGIKTEADVFRLLGTDFIKPSDRD